MVLEVLADSGQVMNDLDPELAQLVGWADPREQQEPRRVDGTAGDDDLAPRLNPRLCGLVLGEVPNAHGATVLDDQLRRLRVRRDDEVLALARRSEECGRRTLPANV